MNYYSGSELSLSHQHMADLRAEVAHDKLAQEAKSSRSYQSKSNVKRQIGRQLLKLGHRLGAS